MTVGSLQAPACLALLLTCLSHTLGQPPDGAGSPIPATKFELPKRIPHPLPPPPDIPEIPKTAASLPELTLEFREVVAGDDAAGPAEAVRILTRSRDRIHLGLPGGKQEWLFLQNPVDPRRLSGLLIDHTEGAIVTYYESDLRIQGVARGWLDALTLGFDARLIEKLSPAGETTEFAGVRFEKLVPKEPRKDGLVEVWWSAELLLPLRVTRKTGHATHTYELAKLARDADPDVLADPVKRFPRYTAVDFADWHEEH